MKVLATGGSGYLGTQIKEFFDADDLSRRSGFDILDPKNLDQVAEYEVVIHLAAKLDKSPEAADEVFKTNVEGSINILKRVRPGAAFIFASTKDVYGRFADNFAEVPETCPTLYSGQSALEWSKLVAEHFVDFYSHQNKFRSCILRMASVYAPPSDGNIPGFAGAYAEALGNGESIRLPGGGSPIRDLLHVKDLCGAIEAFAESVIRHGTYNIGGGRANALSLRSLVEYLEKISGLEAVIDETPLDAPPPNRYITDLSAIRTELGWEPKISLDEGLPSLFHSNIA